MATFVKNKCAELALVCLFGDPPYEVFTVRAKGRLLKVGCHEPVVVDYVYSAPNGAAALVEAAALGELPGWLLAILGRGWRASGWLARCAARRDRRRRWLAEWEFVAGERCIGGSCLSSQLHSLGFHSWLAVGANLEVIVQRISMCSQLVGALAS